MRIDLDAYERGDLRMVLTECRDQYEPDVRARLNDLLAKLTGTEVRALDMACTLGRSHTARLGAPILVGE